MRYSFYIRRTTQIFEKRIKHHAPSTIRLHNQTLPVSLIYRSSDSTIAQHLLAYPNCAKSYKISMFSIFDRTNTSFQLAILEA